MSTQKLRELKLYKKLEKDLTYREKLEEKIRQISNPSSGESANLAKKLNNNKKHFQQQERNAQIQRQNRILFQKIQSQGMRSHYFNKSRSKYRSSKTLDSMEDYENTKNQRDERKYNNFSQNKIHYQQEQSRISFQENEQLMRPKEKRLSKKLMTQLSPEVLEVFRSRMIENRAESQETILFQGIAEIDSIRFKVKISIRDKTYTLAGKNKHTQIMLKMELAEYRKFHREVLMGNPSSIFGFLVIDKGKIRFRTLEEEQEAEDVKRRQMYRIHQEEDEEDQAKNRKHKSMKKYPRQLQQHEMRQECKFLEENNGRGSNPSQEEGRLEKEVFEAISVPIRHYKSDRVKEKEKSKEKQKKKENIFGNMNNMSSMNRRQKTQSKEKYKTLQEYINDRDEYPIIQKDIRSGESTEVEITNKKNRYKLPYI